MTNLAKTQAQWNHFNEEEHALWLSMLRYLRESRDTFRSEREQVIILDGRGYISSVVITGVDYGVNTTRAGVLYARITANGGNWDVNVYKATGAGGGDEVLRATNVAASATGTFTAQNSSGMAGTVTLGASPAAVAADTLQLWCKQDFRKRARVKLDGTGTKDTDTLGLAVQACEAVEAAMESALASVRAVYRRWATELGQSGPDFFGRAFAQVMSDVKLEDPSGSVSRRRTGFGPELKEAMTDDGTAGEQDVLQRVVAAGAGSFDAANTGQGAVASHTPLEHCPAATWRFECEAGTDTGDGGSERFRGVAKIAGLDQEFSFDGLVVGQQWSGPRGFGPITLTRTKTKTNDGSNNNFAAASGAVVSGENDANTNAGVLYVKIEANGSNWDISFYRASTQTAGDLMAKATNVATSAAFTATAKNGSGLTIAWTMGGTPGASTNITLNLNFFVTQNSDGVPDNFTVTTSVTGTPGLIQDILGEELEYSLNSDTSGNETFEDDHVRAGTFPPFAVQDN